MADNSANGDISFLKIEESNSGTMNFDMAINAYMDINSNFISGDSSTGTINLRWDQVKPYGSFLAQAAILNDNTLNL